MGNHPALIPSVVHSALKKRYDLPIQSDVLFRLVDEPSDNYKDIIEGAIQGSVDYIGDGGQFKNVDASFSSVSGYTNLFGGFMEIEMKEEKFSRINLLQRKMNNLSRSMRDFFDDLKWSAFANATGVNTFNGSDWTDPSTGDPYTDIEKALKLIQQASGMRATHLILNTTMYIYLVAFKEYREYQYLGKSNMEKGYLDEKLSPNGLRILVVPDDNTYIATNSAWVCNARECGADHESIPFTTVHRELSENPLTQRYYAWRMATPSVDTIDAKNITKITGLDA